MRKVAADLFAVDVVDRRINNSEATVVSLRMHTSCLQQLTVENIQQGAMRNHVDIIGDGECEHIPPPP